MGRPCHKIFTLSGRQGSMMSGSVRLAISMETLVFTEYSPSVTSTWCLQTSLISVASSSSGP